MTNPLLDIQVLLILEKIDEKPGIDQTTICIELESSRGSLRSRIKDLEAADLIESVGRYQSNRKNYELTERGRTVMNNMRQIAAILNGESVDADDFGTSANGNENTVKEKIN